MRPGFQSPPTQVPSQEEEKKSPPPTGCATTPSPPSPSRNDVQLKRAEDPLRLRAPVAVSVDPVYKSPATRSPFPETLLLDDQLRSMPPSVFFIFETSCPSPRPSLFCMPLFVFFSPPRLFHLLTRLRREVFLRLKDLLHFLPFLTLHDPYLSPQRNDPLVRKGFYPPFFFSGDIPPFMGPSFPSLSGDRPPSRGEGPRYSLFDRFWKGPNLSKALASVLHSFPFLKFTNDWL